MNDVATTDVATTFDSILNAPAVLRTTLDPLWTAIDALPDDSPEWDELHLKIEDLDGRCVSASQRSESLEALLQCLVSLDLSAWKAERVHYSLAVRFDDPIVAVIAEQFDIDMDDEANQDWLYEYRDSAFNTYMKDAQDRWPQHA